MGRQRQGQVQDLRAQEAHGASGHDEGRSGRHVKQVAFTVLCSELTREAGLTKCESACAPHSCTVHSSLQALVTGAPTHSRWLKSYHNTQFHFTLCLTLSRQLMRLAHSQRGKWTLRQLPDHFVHSWALLCLAVLASPKRSVRYRSLT